MLLISSMISTVLPTPAPPNKPILPPRLYGARISTTLIPVSKIAGFVSRSVKEGDGLWIGNPEGASHEPISSTGTPRTLKIRPSVFAPTGTVIGAPVSLTLAPLLRPSVEVIETARTLLLPRSCCTSQVTLESPDPTTKALYTLGI